MSSMVDEESLFSQDLTSHPNNEILRFAQDDIKGDRS